MLSSLRTLTESKRLHKTNALTPLLWLDAIIVGPCVYVAAQTSDDVVRYVLLAFVLLVVLYTVRKYEYWSRTDPNRLHSEDYLVEMRALDIMAQQGGAPRLIGDKEASQAVPAIEVLKP